MTARGGRPADGQPLPFHPVVQQWVAQTFGGPTPAQTRAWPVIARGVHTLLLAPTGSGKTLAAFLSAIDRLMFGPPAEPGCRVLYISPLKALGIDIERNLRAPLAGIRVLAEREGHTHRCPRVGVRTGDTPARERVLQARQPPEILITTPESLYLLLTSKARSMLTGVDTVIVDEIHALAPGKRGSHLFLSLERLEALRRGDGPAPPPAQRIGLSATCRPLEEVARLLGGAGPVGGSGSGFDVEPRPVEVVDAGQRKALSLRVEVPVEDMARLEMEQAEGSGPTAVGPSRPSIWPAIHPRLVELIRAHRSTMVFVNSRRLAERLAGALNELAGEPLALAHHGSLAKDRRADIEDQLKRGALPAIIATSSLELGIDMGAVDLVVQIEAPPSVASGIQRIGRAGHQAGAHSTGVIFPKYRGDLLACAAATGRMLENRVEAMRYPRNPLDVLAQQIVAMVALEPQSVDAVYATVRGAAPFAGLSRGLFESVLDLLAGRYPSEEFAGLAPRLVWDRIAGTLTGRRGAQRIAVANAGTIPDRGLYGVFLAGETGEASRRVGELDEEMVFESRPGDVFLLGASSWRIAEITHDRVLVIPAPGEPGKMPFWRGDGPGRPREFGEAIGELARRLLEQPPARASASLQADHGLDPRAAHNLLEYLQEQREATGEVPSDRTIVVERFLDEVGDWRVSVLSPFGARVHIPWALAVSARLREHSLGEVDVMWSDDGMVFRLPESDTPPGSAELFPAPEDIEPMLMRELSQSSLFASRFRENASRALLLPRRTPGRRTPLWVQRRRAADLLKVASRYDGFPILLETYRECLKDVFDLEGLRALLRDVERRSLRVQVVDSEQPSPFASSLLFDYVANFIYEGDAPLAERRAQALALDQAQLRELLGDAELRELLDPEAVAGLSASLQERDGKRAPRDADELHDLLRRLGALSVPELRERLPAAQAGALEAWIETLLKARRLIEVPVAGESRLAAAEDAGLLRDALGVMPPPGLPDAFLEQRPRALEDLLARHARTHTPFTTESAAARFGLGSAPVRTALRRLADAGRVLEGEFLPGGSGREWCDAEVLRRLKRASLARLRQQVEAVEPTAYAAFLPRWQGLTRPRRGLDGLLDVIEQLQGAPVAVSVLESQVLPARLQDYRPADLDALCAAGEVSWRGCSALGSNDGRIALYLTDHLPRLAPPALPAEGALAERLRALLAERGALFFDDICARLGAFPREVLESLWDMVWAGELGNDTLAPLRSRLRGESSERRARGRGARGRGGAFRSRRLQRPAGSEGRWSLIADAAPAPGPTERLAALTAQLLERHGVLTREAVAAEQVSGGFAALYPVLKGMEEAGRVRRGYFVAGLGAAQFALPSADDRLRAGGEGEESETLVLAASDPANAYGAALPWPQGPAEAGRPQRVAGARVVLHRGALVAFLGRGAQSLISFLPEAEQARAESARALAGCLAALAAREPVLLGRINGVAPADSPLLEAFTQAGFVDGLRGLQYRPEGEQEPAAGRRTGPRARRRPPALPGWRD